MTSVPAIAVRWLACMSMLMLSGLFIVDVDGAEARFSFADAWKPAPELPGHFLYRGRISVQCTRGANERGPLFRQFN